MKMKAVQLKKSKKSSQAHIRKYWPEKTLEECITERDRMFLEQDGKCAICKKPEGYFKKKLAIDHRHSDGLVRGLLCFHCNKWKVGKFTLDTILPVVEYLLKYEDGK